MFRVVRTGLVLLLPCAAILAFAKVKIPGHDSTKIQVLILTGYNSTPFHHWRINVPVLRQILESTGKFEVRIDEEPRGATADTFSGYDVLLLDYSDYTKSLGPTWPQMTRQAYISFLRNGGGVVAFHVTVGSFPEWSEFAKTLGILDREHLGHAPYHIFPVSLTHLRDPIDKGLPSRFDEWGEIYNGYILAPNVRVLATAFDDPNNCLPGGKDCGSGKNEPILWTTKYGKGRVFVTTLGHDMNSISSPSFKTTLIRGTEWVANGNVTTCPPCR